MAYIGNQIRQYSDRVVLDSLTASATADYTLQLNSTNFVPSSAESLTISLNGVIQKPQDSYTVSGSTLSFASALTASDSIDFVIAERGITLQTPSAGSVNTEQLASNAVTTAKIADANVTSAKMFSGFANGITMAESWRLTTSSNIGVNGDVTSNWEVVDNNSYSSLGTGLTESSGIFSFPQTGIYFVFFMAAIYAQAGDTTARFELHTTTDNSTYATVAAVREGNASATNHNKGGANSTIIDVTDTSLVKFKFRTESFDASTNLQGETTNTRTGFTVIRIGDT